MLAADLIESIGSLRRQLRRRTGMPWPNADLTAAELELVRLVRRRPDVRVSTAADELGLAANTVSTLVTRLVERDVLVRTPDPADSRATCLRLTAPARRRIEAWRDVRVAAMSNALTALSPADVARIEAAIPALDRLLANLKEKQGVAT